MQRLVVFCFLVAAVTNLAPVVGVLSVAQMEALYGIALKGETLQVLMRHRALLFGIVGGLLVAGAFRRELRTTATVAGVASMVSFVVLAWVVGGAARELDRIVLADVVASIILASGYAIDRRMGRAGDAGSPDTG